MVKKPHGPRTKTRHKLQKKPRERGLVPAARFMRSFSPGDNVLVHIDPSQHHGMPHKSFHGKVGVVKEKRGRSYLVEVKDRKVKKTVVASPIHLRRA